MGDNLTVQPLVMRIILVALIIAGLIIAAYFYYKGRRRELILKESIRIAALRNLNNSIPLRKTEMQLIERRLPTLELFGRFDPDAFMLAAISENRCQYETWVTDCEFNREQMGRYEQELAWLPGSKYNAKSWRDVEDELFESCKLGFEEPAAGLMWSYTSPAGNNRYSDFKAYSIDDVKRMLSQADVQQHDREARKAVIARERAMMTDSLRYDVLKRGGFRCAICGSTAADGVKLEVDHIVPVSKGGKTELSNLQVLCDRCNGGKRDKL